MSRIFAIDPGTTQSAWVWYDEEWARPVGHGIDDNAELLVSLRKGVGRAVAVEMVASYGMPVGQEVFETVLWAGRFLEAAGVEDWRGSLVYRREVKLHLCGDSRAKDPNIRQALLDRFGPGREKAIGRKAFPGPLYGFKADLWAALGVAVTYAAKSGSSGSP